MKIKTLLAALALSVTPAIAMAMCSGYGHSETANQCGQGQAWDAAAEKCVAVTTS
jgi:hypothetical protein